MYFSSFPVMAYTLDGGKTWQDLTDITVRARVIQKKLKKKALYHFYTVSDHTTPDDIARELYGDPYLHWVVLLVNDMVDPRMDWVWDDERVNQYTYEIYKDQAIHDDKAESKRLNPNIISSQNGPRDYFLEVLATTHHYERDGEWVQKDTEGAVSVTNLDHERRENEKKREIQVLDPRYLQQFLREFKRLMNE